MSLVSELMGLGLPASLASRLGDSVQSSVAAAGTTQGTATAITGSLVSVSSATAGSATGVILPSDSVLLTSGLPSFVKVLNQSTTAITIYPPSAAAINNLATNAGIQLDAGAFRSFWRVSPTLWVSDGQGAGALAPRQWQTGVTAAGTTNANAAAITALNVEVTTTAASTGVILPATLVPGDEVFVVNQGANALLVYPFSGAKINALTATTGGFSVAAGKSAFFNVLSATQIYSQLSA